MRRPYLLLDCYYDERGAAPNFLALLGDREVHVVRCVFERPPSDLTAYAGVLISGSKGSLNAPEAWMDPVLSTLRAVHSGGTPLLGVCFGHQAIARALFGPEAVRPAKQTELGWVEIERCAENPLLEGLEDRFRCFVSHFDEVTPGNSELEVLCRSERCPVEGYQVRGAPTWGVQFHPEMDPDESEALVRSNLQRHAQIERTVEELLAERVDGRHLGATLISNFLALAEDAREAATS